MKYTSRSTTKTTIKVFDITDVEPEQQFGHHKGATIITRLTVWYTEGKDGLRKTSWKVLGSNVLESGEPGALERTAPDWWAKQQGITWPQEIADKNAPWTKP